MDEEQFCGSDLIPFSLNMSLMGNGDSLCVIKKQNGFNRS